MFKGYKDNNVYGRQNEDRTDLHFSFKHGNEIDIFCTFEKDIPLTVKLFGDNEMIVLDKLLGENQEIVFKDFREKIKPVNPWAAAFSNFKAACSGQERFEVPLEDAVENVKYLSSVKASKF